MSRTSDDYAPCIVVYPSGQTRKANCLRANLHNRAEAIYRLRSDLAAWIDYADYDAIREQIAAGQWRQQ
jgi:hypothetical protein